MRNVRDHHPVTAQVRARDFLDTAQFHFFNFTKLAEVHFRPRQHTRDTAARSSRRSFRAFDSVFHVSLNVFAQNTAFTTSAFHFRQVDAKLARQTANQWGSVNVSVVFSELRFAFGFGSRGSRLLSFRRRSRRRCFLFSRSGRRRCAFHFEDHNQRAGFHFIAGADFDFFHGARERRRHFHRGFVAFHGDQRLFSGNFIADFDHHFGDFNFVAADVRYVNVFHARRCCWSSRSRSGFRFRWCCCARFTRHFEDHNQRAGRHFITGVHFDLFHGACKRSRNFHRGLVAFDGDQRLFSFYGVAHFHHHFSHFNFVTADIRNVNVFRRCRSRCCCRRRFFLLFCLSRRSVSCTVGGIENHDKCTGLSFVADRDFDLFHDASLRRRDFHRGFVAFYGDQRLFSFNFVAHFDQNLGDFNFICPDVRYFDFDSHYSFTSYARRGLTLSASMLNLVIASATTFLSISPRLASSPSAATTT
ncbi:Uncharacterised protein [Salmonella enterica subsp. enterica serovar Typhi]|nr:Uncharacterised protein [Salmonella enterica subsp. enterica serovar Typhi]